MTFEDISMADWNLIKSLVEEAREATLSDSRKQDAERSLCKIERVVQSVVDHGQDRHCPKQPTQNWLQHYLEAAIASDLCIQITCGTCGSTPFKSGLVTLASGGLRQDIHSVDQETLRKIAAALAQIHPRPRHVEEDGDFERAAMSIIYFLWSRALGFERQIEPMLAGTWAGTVLAQMKSHYAGRHDRSRWRSLSAMRMLRTRRP